MLRIKNLTNLANANESAIRLALSAGVNTYKQRDMLLTVGYNLHIEAMNERMNERMNK